MASKVNDAKRARHMKKLSLNMVKSLNREWMCCFPKSVKISCFCTPFCGL